MRWAMPPAVEAAFARAAHVVRHRVCVNRVTGNPMEPRGCLAGYDPYEDRYTIRATIQSAHGIRAILAEQIFALPQTRFRVVCDNMGGGFGTRGGCMPEYALSLWASEAVGRPVKWVAERSEGIVSDEQARGGFVDAELALDAGYRFLALRHAYQGSDRRLLHIRSQLRIDGHWTGRPRGRVPDPGDSCDRHGDLHQHHDQRPVSRRRQARAVPRHRGDGRPGRPRTRPWIRPDSA